jgi:RNA polymerase sigma-70 factor (ECF subfamily)
VRGAAYLRLLAHARRYAGAADAEDVLQEAVIVALREGRDDLADPGTTRWLRGVIRNKARMSRRGLLRARRRDGEWQAEGSGPEVSTADPGVLPALPQALRVVALLALTGHSRREIGYLLNLSDAALRQRVVALKGRLKAAGLATPTEFAGLNLDLAYGRIRDALLPQLLRQGGLFATHDPDGHLFVVRRSQNP